MASPPSGLHFGPHLLQEEGSGEEGAEMSLEAPECSLQGADAAVSMAAGQSPALPLCSVSLSGYFRNALVTAQTSPPFLRLTWKDCAHSQGLNCKETHGTKPPG